MVLQGAASLSLVHPFCIRTSHFQLKRLSLLTLTHIALHLLKPLPLPPTKTLHLSHVTSLLGPTHHYLCITHSIFL
jgi:hypothetical protein